MLLYCSEFHVTWARSLLTDARVLSNRDIGTSISSLANDRLDLDSYLVTVFDTTFINHAR